jgi:hypothetical protein
MPGRMSNCLTCITGGIIGLDLPDNKAWANVQQNSLTCTTVRITGLDFGFAISCVCLLDWVGFFKSLCMFNTVPVIGLDFGKSLHVFGSSFHT